MAPSTMSGQHQSRGEGRRPPPPGADSAASHSTVQTAIPSVDSEEPTTQTSRTSLQSPIQSSGAFRVPESPRSASSDAAQKAAKVAIPRLRRSLDAAGDTATRSGGRHRVTHACEPCRHRKTKCSGERPVCRHCQDFKIACYYADGKRDRVKKQFGSMAEKVADYEKLLKVLITKVGDIDVQLIKSALEKETSFDADDAASADNLTIPSVEPVAEEEEPGAESDASAGAGSTGALDRTDEDFTRDKAKDTGFMGKNSEITWLQRLRQENEYGEQLDQPGAQKGQVPTNISSTSLASKRGIGDYTTPLPEVDNKFTVQESSYHLDDFAVTTFEHVDPYEVPTAETAQNLFNAYITRVHPTFPVIGKINLTEQFRKFTSGRAQRPPEKWLAILNLIFAIAAKYSHLIQAEWKGDERDHLIYFTRARLLSVNSETVFEHPDLQVIQIAGLISFYFLCISQINRAWNMAGIAIRWATALGLNMRNDSTTLRDSLKEIRYRAWWALYTLEHRLCSMTGRVNCILDDHCTTPLPVPVEEELFESEQSSILLSKEQQQGSRAPFLNSHSSSAVSSSSGSRSRSATKATESRSPSTVGLPATLGFAKDAPANTSLYFLHLVQLTRLTQGIFHQLYNPAAIDGTWSDVQNTIHQLGEDLEAWYRNLPPLFDFSRRQRDRDFYECRLSLGFFYYGTKIMVHRPCLCRLDCKIPHQSSKSLDFNRRAATTCVDAARDLLQLIPDEPNAVGLIRVGPWWSVLHWLVQATTVLMLEISFRAHHMPEEADSILDASKKGIRWLHALGDDNVSAKRAWALCNAMLHEAVSKIGRDVSDLPERPPGRSPSTGMAGYGQSSSGMQNYSGSMSNPMTSSMMGPAYPVFFHMDTLGQWDQHYPMGDGTMVGATPMHTEGMPDEMPMPTDAEMEFMSNAYHEHQGHQGHQGNNPQQRYG